MSSDRSVCSGGHRKTTSGTGTACGMHLECSGRSHDTFAKHGVLADGVGRSAARIGEGGRHIWGDNYEGLLGRHVRGRESWVSSVDAPIVRREICSAEGLDGAELYHTLIHASRNARRVQVLHSSVNSLRGSESGKRPHGEHCQCGASLSCARAYMSTLQEQLR